MTQTIVWNVDIPNRTWVSHRIFEGQNAVRQELLDEFKI
jgi:hypothetical protein